MLQKQGQFLYHRFSFLLFMVMATLTLQCCGKLTEQKPDSLDLTLAVPHGEDESLFWIGVEKKVLTWKPINGDIRQALWVPGSKVKWAPAEGDKVEFQGIDGEGRVIIAGEAIVGEKKMATIVLRRVL